MLDSDSTALWPPKAMYFVERLTRYAPWQRLLLIHEFILPAKSTLVFADFPN